MKFTPNKIDKKEPLKSKYPFFGKSNGGQGVVLFTASGKGMVVEEVNGWSETYPVGHIYSSWEMLSFDRIENYSITISTD